MEIAVSIDKEKVDAKLKRLKDIQGELLNAGAFGLHACLVEHFKRRQSMPNKHGWAHKGFWYALNGDSIAERTNQPVVSSDKAVITIHSAALARKLSQSRRPIKPGAGKKYLALPATESAYCFAGMPRSYPGIRFAFAHFPGDDPGHKRPALVSGSSASPMVQYWLARKTNPKPDPNATPSAESMSDAVVKSMDRAVKTLIRMTDSGNP